MKWTSVKDTQVHMIFKQQLFLGNMAAKSDGVKKQEKHLLLKRDAAWLKKGKKSGFTSALPGKNVQSINRFLLTFSDMWFLC